MSAAVISAPPITTSVSLTESAVRSLPETAAGAAEIVVQRHLTVDAGIVADHDIGDVAAIEREFVFRRGDAGHVDRLDAAFLEEEQLIQEIGRITVMIGVGVVDLDELADVVPEILLGLPRDGWLRAAQIYRSTPALR